MRRAWTELRSHPERLIAVGLAITISVAFLVACLIFVETETNAISGRLTAESSTSDVLVDASDSLDHTTQVAAVPGIAAVTSTTTAYLDFSTGEGPGLIKLQSLPDRSEFRWSQLSSGTWPASPHQVAVSTVTARSYGLAVGSSLTVRLGGDGSGGATHSQLLQVSGIVDEGHLLLADPGDSGTVDASFFATQPNLGAPTLLVKVAPGSTAEEVAARIQTVLGPDASVRTADAARADALTSVTGTKDLFGYLVVVFSGIALLVGSMIIVNTLSIILGARRHEIGLLRVVGASTGQVRRRLLAEALLIGILGSAAGVALGVVIAVVASTVTGAIGSGFVLPYGRLLLVGTGGAAVTVLAALVPVLRATRVAPLVALRPVAEPEQARRNGRVRLIGGVVLGLAGAGIAVAGLRETDGAVRLAVVGASLIAVGVLVLAGSFVPPLLRLVGRPASRFGGVARLGAVNLGRNPGRASATCTALMLTVGLIVTLQVGASSLRSTSAAALDEQFPVDVTVTNTSGPVSPTVQEAVAAVPGIRAVTPVRIVTAGVRPAVEGPAVQGPAAEKAGETDQLSVQVAAPGAGAEAVVATGLDRLSDRTALAHPNTIDGLGLEAGQTVQLRYKGQQRGFVLAGSDVAADLGTVVVSGAAMDALAPTAPTAAVWASAADRAQAAEVIAGVRIALASQPGLVLAGSLAQVAELDRVLRTVLDVATGLLGVAALIALLGVGNTLSLSVQERRRESALLRALGLQRRQLRWMLAVEAVLLALVGAAVGVAAGLAFGSLGAAALTRETDLGTLHLSVPVISVAVVVALSVLAGAAASVLPARRAANASPSVVLAAS